MRIKTLLIALAVAGLVASIALAAPPPGRGKGGGGGKAGPVAATTGSSTQASSTSTSTTASTETVAGKGRGHDKGGAAAGSCRPEVSLILKGSFVSATADSFAMTVSKANAHGQAFVGKQVTVAVGAGTKFTKKGRATLADLTAADRLNVQVRACKATDTATLKLLAARVVAHSGSGGGDDEAGKTGTTTTGTTTTGTTPTTTTTTTTGTTTTGATTTTTTTTGTTTTGTTTTGTTPTTTTTA